MSKFLHHLVVAAVAATSAATIFAADYTDGDTHKNDYKWAQFNLMASHDAKLPSDIQEDKYMEMEFGGRSGIWDLYGYVDWFNILDNKRDDRANKPGQAAQDETFTKIDLRMSLDGLTRKDLSFGPVKEVYLSSESDIGSQQLYSQYIGVGADVQVPWLGKTGVNVEKRYVRENYGAANEGSWDGYALFTNFFKPFINFPNKTFISYQGYFDYQWDANKVAHDGYHASHSTEFFNGIYWHTKRYAVGYGLKYFVNMALVQNNEAGGNSTTGFGHYFSVTYKF